METGKICDVEPLTRICFGCKAAEAYRLSDPDQYNEWKENHSYTCLKNHSGSARCYGNYLFNQNIQKIHGKENSLCYSEYYGDGDSKSFTKVKYSYEGLSVKKLECVEHIQKRVGTRLCALKRKKKEIYIAEKKSASKEKSGSGKKSF